MSLESIMNDFSEDQVRFLNDQASAVGDPVVFNIEAGTLTVPEETEVNDWIVDYNNLSAQEKDDLKGPARRPRQIDL